MVEGAGVSDPCWGPGQSPGFSMLTPGPLAAYRARVAAGELAADPAQADAAVRLQALWETLRGYEPAPAGRPGLLGRLFGRAPAPVPMGLYLVGQVGRGKSMLMDLFFDTADVPRRRRIHFHRFIQEAHSRFHAHKREYPEIDDPIPKLADSIAAEASLLCFDEFQVHDIADAMILGRLFQALFARGVVMVSTSNTAPDNLFRGQPGRDAFLPFIAILKNHVAVYELDSARDFRRQRLRGMASWHVPPDGRADMALDDVFTAMGGGETPRPIALTVMGRALRVPLAAGKVARFDFEALCGTALGAGDYLAIAARFHTVVLDGIPRLSPDNFDRARRFIVLVDTLYDHRVKLYASAEAMPDQLYMRGENAAMFERTASRLEEMRSQEYLDGEHFG